MQKKLIPIALLLCLIFSISVMAENTNKINDETVPEVSGQIPNEIKEQPQGGRGGMGIPPEGMNRGQMPEGMEESLGNMQNDNMNTQVEQPTDFLSFVKTYSTPITSVILLVLAFIFVIFYRRKNY